MKTLAENIKNPQFVSKGKITESDLYANTNFVDSIKRSIGVTPLSRLTKLDMSVNSKWQTSSEEEETPQEIQQQRKVSTKKFKEEEKKVEPKQSPKKKLNKPEDTIK